MTLIELAKEVRKMDELQQRYFKGRSQVDLEASKLQEKQVRHLVAAILDHPTLFGNDQ